MDFHDTPPEAAFRAGGRLFYAGAGTSGRLGVLDASEIPPTFGADPSLVQGLIAGGPAALTRSQEGAEDRPDGARADVDAAGIRKGDFLIGIAASGTTESLNGLWAPGSSDGFAVGGKGTVLRYRPATGGVPNGKGDREAVMGATAV